MFENIILLFIAVLPCFYFFKVIRNYDVAEPEPLALVFKVMWRGALMVIPAGIIEVVVTRIFPLLESGEFVFSFILAFFIIAPVEEFLKFTAVKKTVWNDPNFDEEYDGIVYSGMAATGFAMLENIIYVLGGGLATGLARAGLAIPLHVFCGVTMGYYIGRARFEENAEKRRQLERDALLIPVLIHGFYDFLVFTRTAFIILIFPFIIGLWRVSRTLHRVSLELSARRWERRWKELMVLESASEKYEEVKENNEKSPDTREILISIFQEMIPEKSGWKWIASWFFFLVVALLWFFLFIGNYVAESDTPQLGLLEFIVSGFIITFIPAALGLFFRISWKTEQMRILNIQQERNSEYQ